MKINIQGYKILGTPSEINELIKLVNQEKEGYEIIKSTFKKPKILLCNKTSD